MRAVFFLGLCFVLRGSAQPLPAQQPATPIGQPIDTPRARAVVYSLGANESKPLADASFPRLILPLSDGELQLTGTPIQVKRGEPRWIAAGPVRIENLRGTSLLLAEIILKEKPPSPGTPLSKLDPLGVDPQHYSLVLENAQVRVLRVRFGPMEKGLLHEHTYTNFVVYLNDQARGKMGEMRMDGPRTHTEENPLDHAVERISIDLK